jgi:CRP-like cAMP-binding protein
MATTRVKATPGGRHVQVDPALIRHVPLLSQLTDEQVDMVTASVERRRYRKGQVIIERGHKSDALFILLSGRAHVAIDQEEPDQLMLTSADPLSRIGKPRHSRQPGESREVIVAMLRPGDHFGEMSMIDGRPHSATVRAEVITEVLALGRAGFMQCLAENLAMTHAVMKSLIQRLRQADAKIESLALIDVYGRVARTLLELAVVDPDTGEGHISERLSRQYLAKTVGASREMVSRVMKDLVNRGFITEYEGGKAVLRPHRFKS